MDARTADSLGFTVDTAVCFSDHKGRHKKAIEKRQTKLLDGAAPLLRTLLRPGEKVLLVVPACSPMSAMEQLTTGWVIYYIKRCLLVVTDHRILELAVKRNLLPRMSAAEIEYAGVAKPTVSSFLSRSLKLLYRSGHSDTFQHLDSKAAAKLKALLPPLVAQAAGATGESGRQHLCPRCAARLRSVERCPQCFLEFRTRAKAARYSLIYPGGGYFYTGHPVLGFFDALAELMLIVLLVTSLVDLAMGTPEAIVGVLAIGALLAIEKALSVYHAQHYVKEYLPVEREITPARAA